MRAALGLLMLISATASAAPPDVPATAIPVVTPPPARVPTPPRTEPAPGKFQIADVTVNGVAQRPSVIRLMPDGEILVRREDASAWNLEVAKTPTIEIRDIAYISLSSLAGVRAAFDGALLTIEAQFASFQGTRIDMLKTTMPAIDSGRGAYLNYDLTSLMARGQKPVGGGAVEAVIFSDTLSFSNSGIGSSSADGRQLVRYESTLRQDFLDNARTLVLGDAVSRSGTLARSFRFGGVSYGSNFSTRPDMVTFALPTVPGEATIPTAADLLINGQRSTQLQLPPGPFEIANVPAINGAGEIQLVTRDLLGRQQVVVVPFYVTPALLRPGLVDFGFEAGKIREDFGLASWNYGRNFARGLFRMGLTPAATMETYAESTGRQHVAGGGVTASLGNVMLANLTAAASRGTDSGGSVAASLERSAKDFSFSVRGQFASRHFSQVGETPDLRYRANAGAGVGLGSFGNLSALYATESRYGRERVQTAALTYQMQLGKRVTMLANVSATRADDGLHHFAGVVVVMPLDVLAMASLSASSTVQDGRTEHIVEFRENLPVDQGVATRMRLSRAEHSRVDAGATWQGNYGQLLADASANAGNRNLRVGANGSVVFAGGMIRPVRQLGDAFAIVAAPGQGGLDVYLENQHVATTNAAGFALIPRLRPYESNSIMLDTLKLTLSTNLKSARRTVTPARRAGVTVNFETVKTQGALVRLHGEDGQPLPAGTLVKVGEEFFPVATNGDAWITALKPDAATRASAAPPGGTCTVEIPPADGKRAVTRMGPFICRSGTR